MAEHEISINSIHYGTQHKTTCLECGCSYNDTGIFVPPHTSGTFFNQCGDQSTEPTEIKYCDAKKANLHPYLTRIKIFGALCNAWTLSSST